ncbi:four helix bundle protein [Candidatus Beckwithbacteria bacterium]|nr:four helix bundle protein [Candidatus Beckwithbacteria bacterium]
MINFLKLNNLNSYKIAFNISNYIWEIIIKWDNFSRNSFGSQLVRSIDSISANIAEGFGRYSKKDKIKFYRYSFGSLKETQDWIQKAKIRKLINNEEYKYIMVN